MDTASVPIAERIAAVQAEIRRACQRVGRSPDGVTLIAVSKTHPASEVIAALNAGLHHFGENRIEEVVGKIPAVAELTDKPIRWHMIGHVQSRKARYLTAGFTLLHSLDSVKLAERLSRFLVEQNTELDALLEINISGEESKEGWNAYGWRENPVRRAALWEDIRLVLAQPGIRVRGLMTMAPIVEDAELARPVFAGLRHLRDTLAADFPQASWADLSMGMTDDYPVAVEEGATMVRVGRAIFGQRNR
jgi:pyridoxal phosphate enzyme (YggS family)